MKKTLLTLAAILLTAVANAQFADVPTAGTRLEQAPAAAIAQTPAFGRQAQKAPRRVDLASNQRLAGYYLTDELAEYGLGTPAYSGDNAAAVIFNRSILGKFIGSKIVGIRIGLCAAVGTRAFVTPVKNSIFGNDTISVNFTPQKGWNLIEVPDSQQLVIGEDIDSLLVGFAYPQSSDNQSDDAFPLSLVGAGDVYSNLLLYCNISGTYNGWGLAWYNFGNTYGNLSVQLVLQNDAFPGHDIILSPVTTSTKYYPQGGEVKWSAKLLNFGGDQVNYTLNVNIDGKVATTYDSPTPLASNATTTATGSVTLPDTISIGDHKLTLEVASINGDAPTEGLADDTVSTTFNVFKNSKPRQKQLIEHFTSQSCTYCPVGDDLLTAIEDMRSDIARVSIHGNMGARDEFNTDNCETIQAIMGVSGWPMADFNRTIIPDLTKNATIAYTIGYQPENARFFSEFIDGTAEVPSFVALTIDPSWDKETRELTVTVRGEGIENAKDYLDNPALTVYLTEDSLVAKQLNLGKWITNYVHNNVFRDVLTSLQGESIEWDGDNFTRTFTYTVPETFKAENLNIVAFVAPFINYYALDRSKLAVNNCEKVSLRGAIAAGIADIEANHGNQLVRARYNAAGQRIWSEQHGLNIIQYANGKTAKVMIK